MVRGESRNKFLSRVFVEVELDRRKIHADILYG